MRTIASERVLEAGENSFGLLRLVLAALVIVSHSWSLGAHGPEPLSVLSGGTTLGYLAVYGFFGLSGMLVALSAERSAPGKYLWNRARRILPGYWGCLVVTAFGFGALVCWLQELPVGSTLSTPPSASARSFLVNNFPMRVDQYELGQALEKLPHKSINGALWSLPYEFVCYLAILLVVRAWLHAGRRFLVLLAVLVVSVLLLLATQTPTSAFEVVKLQPFGVIAPKQFAPLWATFLIGAVLALERERVPFSPPWVALACALFLTSIPAGLLRIGGPLFFAYVILGLGRYLPRVLRPIGGIDLSYGLYLYGFPVGQAIVASGHPPGSGLALAALTILGTLPLAAASWFAVERPFLRTHPSPTPTT